MTYLEEMKVEAQSISMKLTSVMEGQMVGRAWIDRKRKEAHAARSNPDGNPGRGEADPGQGNLAGCDLLGLCDVLECLDIRLGSPNSSGRKMRFVLSYQLCLLNM